MHVEVQSSSTESQQLLGKEDQIFIQECGLMAIINVVQSCEMRMICQGWNRIIALVKNQREEFNKRHSLSTINWHTQQKNVNHKPGQVNPQLSMSHQKKMKHQRFGFHNEKHQQSHKSFSQSRFDILQEIRSKLQSKRFLCESYQLKVHQEKPKRSQSRKIKQINNRITNIEDELAEIIQRPNIPSESYQKSQSASGTEDTHSLLAELRGVKEELKLFNAELLKISS